MSAEPVYRVWVDIWVDRTLRSIRMFSSLLFSQVISKEFIFLNPHFLIVFLGGLI